MAINERLLTEHQRQEQYVSELPTDYQFPLFSGRQAVESQRRSGYKNTARAAREIVDNAIEAGAKNIHVVFDRPTTKEREKGDRKESVTAIAFIDDGPGMGEKMLRYSLTWGGGTHFKAPSGIGRFGFGLPNSSINQTRHVEVYSKTTGGKWFMAFLDINPSNVPEHGLKTIEPAVPAELPKFVNDYMKKNGIELDSGTVVVWIKPDRLSYRVASTLRTHLVEDFGVVYRGMLDDIAIVVDGVRVEKVDPLFLTPGARLYKPAEEGGATMTLERALPLKYFIDPITGAQHLEFLDSEIEMEKARRDENAVIGVVYVRIARFPYGFALGERKYKGTDEYKRYEIRKERRGMAFVRAGREIDTVDVFPKTSKDEGLGNWPLLQAYAYHWAIEAKFGPEFDEAFGIGNDKQTVRPIEDFWRVMTAASIDRALQEEQRAQQHMRDADARRQREAEQADPSAPTPATQAAAQAALLLGKADLPSARKEEAQARLTEEITRRATGTGRSHQEVREAIEEEAKRKEYAIDFFESEGGVFYKPSFGNGYQKVAEINRKHPFYEIFYVNLLQHADARARNAVDLLLLALADAELKSEDIKKDLYEHDREHHWSAFLKFGLRVLERLQRPDEEPEEQEQAAG